MSSVLGAFAATEVVKTVSEWWAVRAEMESIAMLDKLYHDFEHWAANIDIISVALVIGFTIYFWTRRIDESIDEPTSHNH